MIVIAFVFSVIGLVGLTFIVVEGKIASGCRKWWKDNVHFNLFGHDMNEMVDCHQCAGFWIGLIGFPVLLAWMPTPSKYMLWNFLMLPMMFLISGFATSFLSMSAKAVLDWLSMTIDIPLGELELNDQKTIESLGDQTSDHN
jgi:hypothetical protein